MLPAFLLQLLSSVVGGFSPAGQAQITPFTTGKPIDQLAPFLLDLFSKIAQTTGVVPPGVPVTTNEQAIAATAEFSKLKATNQELVAQIEEHALDYLDKIAPFVKQLHAMEMERKEQSIKGMDSAAKRNLLDRWDMTKALVLSSEGLAWAIVLGSFSGVGAAIAVEEYNLALAILGIAGTITGNVLKNRSQAYDYRFDGTESSNAIRLSTDAVAKALPKQP